MHSQFCSKLRRGAGESGGNTIRKTVFLFDIDSTLLNSGGLSVESYRAAFLRVLGKPYSIRAVDCAGRTDPWIVREVLLTHGHADLADDEKTRDEIFRYFQEEMSASVEAGYSARVLPGVAESLDYLRSDERAVLALLSGNLKQGARNKLRAAGLLRYFDEESFSYSAFGSDACERDELSFIALARLRQAFALRAGRGDALLPQDIWIVGDSVHDISCARAAGFRVLAVASGTTRREELAEKKPDILADELSADIFRNLLDEVAKKL